MNKISFNNFIQIAGIIDQAETNLLLQCGVKFLGFPLRLPVNKEDISEQEAAKIITDLKPPNYGIIISYSSTQDEIFELCSTLNSYIIQLHGPINKDILEKVKTLKPSLTIIKSLVVTENNEASLYKKIEELEPIVDAFITDTYDPVSGASGATGKTHNWEISRNIVKKSRKPVILAGGLNPENVYNAIMQVEPHGVDVHTGVENSFGRKDKVLVNKFIAEAKRAFQDLQK